MVKKSEHRDLFPGALELMILKSLNWKPMHGYALAQRLKDISEDYLQIEEGSLYPALQRMLKTGWLETEMGLSARNRPVRIFKVTDGGRKVGDLMGWLRRLFSRRRLYNELSETIREHLEEKVADLMDQGMTREQAERVARRDFGNVTRIEERSREVWQWPALEGIVADVRFALRQLIKSPGFTITAVLTLALGIGATTAIFTLVEQVMLQSLSVTRLDQLWRVGFRPHCCEWAGCSQDHDDDAPGNWNLFPWEAYKLFRANTTGFQELAALQAGNQSLAVRRAGSAGLPETANGEYVSGNFFETLGVSAWRGRLLINADDREGVPPVAVMSFHAWQKKYGSDPLVVGSTYQINGRAFTIIGVAPAGFIGANVTSWGVPDIWLPLSTEPLLLGGTARIKNPRVDWLDLIGRVRAGTNPKTLEAQLQSELHGWLASHVADMR